MSQQTEKCGCRINAVNGLALESPTIEYCRTHAAALNMLEALKTAQTEFSRLDLYHGEQPDEQIDAVTLNIVSAAIKKATP